MITIWTVQRVSKNVSTFKVGNFKCDGGGEFVVIVWPPKDEFIFLKVVFDVFCKCFG